MYVFFDTETNGLPKHFNARPDTSDNWPRIIQLAFVVLDENFIEIDSYCELIKPDGWVIPNEKFWIDNGYSTENNSVEGVPIYHALNAFISAVEGSHYGIAHNMSFDFPVIASEMMRYEMKATSSVKKICTMKSTTNYCKIPGRGGYKWPKLEELHEKLFGVKFDNAHDALADVRATVRCFKVLVRDGVIELH